MILYKEMSKRVEKSRKCAVSSCTKYKEANCTMYGFPPEVDRKRLWCQILGIKEESVKSASLVCINHFSIEHLRGKLRRTLTLTAVPMPPPPPPPPSVSTSQNDPTCNHGKIITKLPSEPSSTCTLGTVEPFKDKRDSSQQPSSSTIAHVKTNSSSWNVSEQPSDDFDAPIVIVGVQGSVGDKNKGLSKKNEILANLELKHNIICSGKNTPIHAVTPSPSIEASKPRKRKQELDLRSEFIPLKKSANVASVEKPNTSLMSDSSNFSDHDYFQTSSNENSNERNKENLNNINECLQNDDTIKVNCEICSTNFVSLKAFLDHLKKSPINQQHHDQQSDENENNYFDLSNDNESDVDEDEALESASKTVTIRKLRVGYKLLKWQKPRTLQIQKLTIDSEKNSSLNNYSILVAPTSQPSCVCSCGRKFTKSLYLSFHLKRTGHEMPSLKKFICNLCSPQSAIEGEEINEDSNTTTAASSLVATTTTETSSSNSVVGFKSKKGLKAHLMAEHPGEKIIKCAVDTCSETFWEYYDLQFHLIRQHNILQKFECKICLEEGKKSSTFRLTSELNQHVRDCHQEKGNSAAKNTEYIPMLCPGCFPPQETSSETEVELIDSQSKANAEERQEQEGIIAEEHQEGVEVQEGTENSNSDGPEKIVYTNLHKLIRHMKAVHSNGPKIFKCTHPGCNRDFYYKRSLKNHGFFHGPQSEYPYKCVFEGCDCRFVHHYALLEHHKDHIGEKRPTFPCHICSKVFRINSKLTTHLKAHNSEFPCPECPRKFNRLINLSRHVKIVHEGLRPFKCRFCDVKYTTVTQLKDHESAKHTGELRHACLLCDSKYTTTAALAQHKAKVHSIFPIPRFKDPKNVGQQPKIKKKTQYKKKDFVCSECGVVRGNHLSLKNHLYHEHGIGSKTFLCSSCGRAYLSLYLLNIHIRTSHDEEQKKKLRARKRLLYRSRQGTPNSTRKKVHTNRSLPPYKCSLCPEKDFRSQCGLTRHLKSHNRESLLNCTFPGCRSSFTSNYRLYRHSLTHQDQNQTGSRFNRQPSPTFHLHEDVDDDDDDEEEEEELETQEVESALDLDAGNSIVVFREDEMDEQQDSYDSD